jgi:hypothetical protein
MAFAAFVRALLVAGIWPGELTFRIAAACNKLPETAGPYLKRRCTLRARTYINHFPDYNVTFVVTVEFTGHTTFRIAGASQKSAILPKSYQQGLSALRTHDT